MQTYLTFEITESGNLKISLTPEGREELQEMIEGKQRDHSQMWDALIEHDACNGGYRMFQPEWCGALTNSPVIVHNEFVNYPDQGNPEITSNDAPVYWFPNYMVENEFETMLDEGFIIFTVVV